MQHHLPIGPHPAGDGRRVRHGCIAAAIPARCNAHTPAQIASGQVERRTVRPRFDPCRAQGGQAIPDPDAAVKHLPADRGLAVVQRVQNPKLQRIHPQLVGQQVKQRLLRNRRLRHAEAPECACGWIVSIDGAGPGGVIPHHVGAGCVDRHAGRHGWAPTGIGPGVEIAMEGHARQPPVSCGPDPGGDLRRVPFGGGLHRFRPGIGDPAGPPGFQRGQGDIGLHRQVEF